MRFQEFVGPSYETPAVQVDAQRTVNLYPEVIRGDGGASETAVLLRTPGLLRMQVLGDSPGRGMFTVNGRCFAVVGSSFYELLSPTEAVLRGTLTAGGTSSPVRIRTNGVQILVLGETIGFIFTLATNAWQQIVDPEFPAAVGLAVVDTYFICIAAGTNQFSISSPLNGLAWAGLDFGSSQEADHVLAIEELHGYLWVFGSESVVVFQDTGNASFPFQRVAGSKIEMGIGAPLSVVKLDNSLFWLGSSSRGPAVVYRADGFLPSRISNHALEAAIQKYSTTADATAYAYEERGHLFYRIDFPTANATWVYDVATKLWHERGYWDAGTGSYQAHPGRFHAFCFGKHLVLDYASGAVYDQSLAYADDNGNPLRWLRRAPHITTDERRRLFYQRFELLTNTGFDPAPGADPLVFLRWSNDGGVTWSSDLGAPLTTGQVGEYGRRVIWRRLGAARSRVFEVVGSDPTPELVLIGAELRVERGLS